MAFAETLSVFLADFGDAGTLAGQPVRGIFDAPSSPSLGIQAAEPQFQLPSASVPASVFDTTLVIPQGSFKVREAVPDGTGMTLLLLTKA
jgi:hypothetical protein